MSGPFFPLVNKGLAPNRREKKKNLSLVLDHEETLRENMYKSFGNEKKKLGMQAVALLFRGAQRLRLLRQRAAAAPTVRRRPPVDAATDKLFQSVVALSKQVLEVPAPGLGFLRRQRTYPVTLSDI